MKKGDRLLLRTGREREVVGLSVWFIEEITKLHLCLSWGHRPGYDKYWIPKNSPEIVENIGPEPKPKKPKEEKKNG